MIYDFEDDVAQVSLNGKFGLINIKGKEIVSPRYEEIEKRSKNFFRIYENGRYIIAKLKCIQI